MAAAKNKEIAAQLEETARLLDEQGANRFRARAYREAAGTILGLERSVGALIEEEGLEALQELPGIGEGLARAISEIAASGRLQLLEHLRGESDPLRTLASAPGVGAQLAERLHEELGISTLEELETAAYDGRLEEVPGFGPKRITAIREALETRLGQGRRRARGKPEERENEPAVSELLEIDREYREKASRGRLKKIAPRRFNPGGEAWLPVLHKKRDRWSYTVLYSNTARAHELGKTDDWVVIYFADETGERQRTVVTAQQGALSGLRVVRGREAECAAFYKKAGKPKAA